MIFDTHAHYDDEAFAPDRASLLSAMPAAGVARIVDPGCDLRSSRAAVALAETYPFVYAAVGIHPENCGDFVPGDLDALRTLAAHPKVVAIGEIGLDYYWEQNPPRDFQKTIFRAQLDLARELDLPVILHDREAHGNCMDIIREYSEIRGVFHCFSGSWEMAKELLTRGWYLGFDGPVTYKNAKKTVEVARNVPLDRLVLETDSPYLTPVPHRGERNDSRNIPYIAAAIAAARDIAAEEVLAAAWDNGCRLFGLDKEV